MNLKFGVVAQLLPLRIRYSFHVRKLHLIRDGSNCIFKKRAEVLNTAYSYHWLVCEARKSHSIVQASFHLSISRIAPAWFGRWAKSTRALIIDVIVAAILIRIVWRRLTSVLLCSSTIEWNWSWIIAWLWYLRVWWRWLSIRLLLLLLIRVQGLLIMM